MIVRLSLVLTLFFATPALAEVVVPYTDSTPQPPSLRELQAIEKGTYLPENDTDFPIDIRAEALEEAALSYGMRGGLAMRTYEIRKELDQRATYMDKIFDFRQLLIPAPSGFLIEPPIVSESLNATLINTQGLEAAVSDRVLNINKNARIVSTPRNWRTYLERTWGEVTPPPDVLRPIDREERKRWIEDTRRGWENGYEQANEIFQDDLARLTRDYTGMVRYRSLLAQNMISQPYALQVDRGVTGGGDEMRIGDRAVEITGLPELVPGYEQWQPANR